MALKILTRFRAIDQKNKSAAVEKLITASTPDFDFFVFAILSILMATFGLLINSVAVIIGSMLVAPILYPVLSLALGLSISDQKIMSRSIGTLSKTAVLGVFVAAAATLIFSPDYGGLASEIIARTEPSLLYFAVALLAGFAVSFALVNDGYSEAFPGIAVSVALIPPLSVIGIGLAKFSWETISGSLILFLLNILGIVFASLVSFSLMNLHKDRKLAEKTVEKEEKRVEKEEEKVEELEEEVKNGNA